MIPFPETPKHQTPNSQPSATDKFPSSSPQHLLDWVSAIIIHAQSGSAEDQETLYQLARMAPQSSTSFPKSVEEVIDLISKVAKEKIYNPKLYETARTAQRELLSHRSSCSHRGARQGDLPYNLLNLP